MSKAITPTGCEHPGCVLSNRQHDTHKDQVGREWWIAQCGGCGCRWATYDETELTNAACERCR